MHARLRGGIGARPPPAPADVDPRLTPPPPGPGPGIPPPAPPGPPAPRRPPPVEAPVVPPDCRRGAGRALEHMPLAGGVDDAEPADTDEAGDQGREQHGPIISGKLCNKNKTQSRMADDRRRSGDAALTERGHGPRNGLPPRCHEAASPIVALSIRESPCRTITTRQ